MSFFHREQILECVKVETTRSIQCDGTNRTTMTLSGTNPDFMSVVIGTFDSTLALRKKFRVTVEEIEVKAR